MRHGTTHAKYVLMWTEAKAPSLAEMEAMAHEVFERLPKTFRTLCQGVIIRVDDFPTDEVLDEMQAQTEFDLLGLFQGVGLPHQSQSDVAMALKGQARALKQAEQVEFACRLHLVQHLVGRKIVDADDHPLAQLAKGFWQALENLVRHRLHFGERGCSGFRQHGLLFKA